MATTRTAHTDWQGSLTEGAGRTTLDSSGLGKFDVTWASRSEEANGKTSPEELLAAAHSSCFSMSFSSRLAKAGATQISVLTSAEVDFQPGEGITAIRLHVTGHGTGLDDATFRELAEDAKANCPLSKALQAVPISLTVG
jgi:osmotically inducible protein OsmC